MKFKILIVLLWRTGVSGFADGAEQSKSVHVPHAEAQEQKPRSHELQKWMLYQNRKQQLKGMNFEKLPSEFQRLALTLDYRLEKHFTKGRKLPGDTSSTDVPLYTDIELKNMHTVHAQLRLMYLQMYEVIRQALEDPTVASPELVKLLTSFLQHLQYLFEDSDNFGENPPPVLYNLSTNQTISPYCDSPTLYLPDEEFLDEQNDQIVELFDQYNMNKLHLIRKMVLIPNQNDKAKNQLTANPHKVSIRKLNRDFQSGIEGGDQEAPQKPKFYNYVVNTKVYTATPYDIPIEDRVREYQKDYVLNIDTLQNFAEMISTLREEYARIFATARKLRGKMSTGIYQGEGEPSIEDFDEVVVMCKSIVTQSNPHQKIMNQIIATFRDQRPDAKFFYRLYDQQELSNRIDQKRHDAAVDRTHHDNHIDNKIIPPLRRHYYGVIREAVQSEKIYDSFAYQTDTLRVWPGSEKMHPDEIKGALKELKRVIPILIRFADAFDGNFIKLIRNLKALQSGHPKVFDAGANLESHLNIMSMDLAGVTMRRAWQGLGGGRRGGLFGLFNKKKDRLI